jgi:hypothetical protein
MPTNAAGLERDPRIARYERRIDVRQRFDTPSPRTGAIAAPARSRRRRAAA